MFCLKNKNENREFSHFRDGKILYKEEKTMNSFALTGILKGVVDKRYRDLEYDSPFSNDNLKDVRHIKVIYWTSQCENRLITLNHGTRVLIHGHLEEHEIFGTILLAEELEVIG